jgi:hypothetical protein
VGTRKDFENADGLASNSPTEANDPFFRNSRRDLLWVSLFIIGYGGFLILTRGPLQPFGVRIKGLFCEPSFKDHRSANPRQRNINFVNKDTHYGHRISKKVEKFWRALSF